MLKTSRFKLPVFLFNYYIFLALAFEQPIALIIHAHDGILILTESLSMKISKFFLKYTPYFRIKSGEKIL